MHLIRSFADLEHLLVAVEARDRVLLHEAVAAVQLEGVVDDPVRELARVELCHRGFLGERPFLVLQPGGPVDEAARRLDLDGHVRELELHSLEGGDRLAELLPLLRVLVGEVVRALRQPEAHGCDRDPPAVEDLEELLKAAPTLAEEVALRHRATLKRKLARVGGAPPELPHRRRDRRR